MEEFLKSINAPEWVVTNFLENGITIELLFKLSENNLKELCPHMGTRILIAEFIAANEKTESIDSESLTTSQGEPNSIPTNPTNQEEPNSIPTTTNPTQSTQFDLKTLLQTSVGGASIIKFYETNGSLNDTKRNQLTDIIIKHIYTYVVNHKITYEDYNIIAAKIVTLFPKESSATFFTRPVPKRRSVTGRPVAARGKLVDKVRNLLYKYKDRKRNIEDTENNPPESSTTKKPKTEDSVHTDIVWLKVNTEPWDEIIKKWKNTSTFRSASFMDVGCNNINDIFKAWPILNDPRADALISIDFEEKYPSSGMKFYSHWDTFFNKIVSLKNTIQEDIKNQLSTIENCDEDQKLPTQLDVIVKLIPPKGRLNKKVKFSTQEAIDSIFIVVVNAGDVDAKIEEIKQKARSQKQPVQPYVILQGTITNCESPLLVIDSIKYQFNSISKAFDSLFKAYHVFNARYPRASDHIHLLIQRCVYQIKTKYDNIVPYIADILRKLETDPDFDE